MPPAQPERRKTTTIQRISIALDVSALIAIGSLAFWQGRQAQQVEEIRQEQAEQRATSAAFASAVARIDVIESKGESTQTLVRDLKADLNERLRRIEDKLDANANRRR